MTTESRAPSIGESQQGGNSEAPCSSGCVHVSDELLHCVRGEVINFDDLWDWDWEDWDWEATYEEFQVQPIAYRPACGSWNHEEFQLACSDDFWHNQFPSVSPLRTEPTVHGHNNLGQHYLPTVHGPTG